MLMGLFVPHNPRANVVSTMICLTVVSAAVFILVLDLNGKGVFKIGTAEWPAVQANSVALNAKIFGDIGIEAIFQGAILYILVPCFAFGIIAPILLRLVPENVTWRKWLPD